MCIQYCQDMMNTINLLVPWAVVNDWTNTVADLHYHADKNRGHYAATHRLLIPYLQYYNYHYLNLSGRRKKEVKKLSIKLFKSDAITMMTKTI